MDRAPVVLDLPFTGSWLVQNSPARRVPSHGTDLLGSRYAIDFVAVDERRRSTPDRTWRSWLATEPPHLFLGFGAPILAPVTGTVVATHDGETDHEARRSQLTLVPYALGQGRRLRQGPAAIAGNHLVIALGPGGPYVALAHLKAGSLRVAVGKVVEAGEHVADCGNSGNSTEPHLHLQVSDRLDLTRARGVPIVFRSFSQSAGAASTSRENAVPAERSVVRPLS